MMRRGLTFLACGFALYCFLTTAAIAAEYDVIVRTVRVNPVKFISNDGHKNGWDFLDGPPDPYIQINTGGKVRTSSVKKDATTASYKETLGRVSSGDELRMAVWDKDLKNDDPVGGYIGTVTPEMLKKKFYTFSFDKVQELVIEFRKR